MLAATSTPAPVGIVIAVLSVISDQAIVPIRRITGWVLIIGFGVSPTHVFLILVIRWSAIVARKVVPVTEDGRPEGLKGDLSPESLALHSEVSFEGERGPHMLPGDGKVDRSGS